ncbi:MAG TPA: hypothetical protein VFS43_39915 [Polyangiaceae bacterium]|nr:hypothetical protein [Polyangiaceae bacterium]
MTFHRRYDACVEGRCTYVGCETDKECQLYLAGNLPDPPFSGQRDIVCVPKPAAPAPAGP